MDTTDLLFVTSARRLVEVQQSLWSMGRRSSGAGREEADLLPIGAQLLK